MRRITVKPSVEEMVESWRENLYLEGTIEVLGGYWKDRAGDGGMRWDVLYAEAYRQGILDGLVLASRENADNPPADFYQSMVGKEVLLLVGTETAVRGTLTKTGYWHHNDPWFIIDRDWNNFQFRLVEGGDWSIREVGA